MQGSCILGLGEGLCHVVLSLQSWETHLPIEVLRFNIIHLECIRILLRFNYPVLSALFDFARVGAFVTLFLKLTAESGLDRRKQMMWVEVVRSLPGLPVYKFVQILVVLSILQLLEVDCVVTAWLILEFLLHLVVVNIIDDWHLLKLFLLAGFLDLSLHGLDVQLKGCLCHLFVLKSNSVETRYFLCF